ncbi:MAG: NAD(P)H:quinone oxidoreductase [Alphaproteobacteria bacterium]
MTKVLVLYYSFYGHIEAMANAVAEGAGKVGGVEVSVKRVPETIPEDVLKKAHAKLDQDAPVATVDELANYDAIVLGIPTRYGRMVAQMANFWDQTGPLWAKGALVGKVGSIFTASATQHGGQESTILGSLPMLLHHGLVYVGLPYSAQGQTRIDEMTGGSPYGASTITGGDGSRMPSDNELELARFQGQHVAEVARKLAAGAK